jgi:RNA polymerase sigma-70 factor (ECF subfamily)
MVTGPRRLIEMNLQEFQSKILPIKNKLYRFALRIVEHGAEAEDIVQEVFIKFWNNRQHMDAVANQEAWLVATTKNLSIDKLRSKHRRLEPMRAGFDLRDNAQTPFQKMAESDIIDSVKNLMNLLPEKQKQVMHLRDIEGLSYQEIAESLDLPVEQVKVSLHRARKAVRQGLEKLEAIQMSTSKT